MVVVVWDALANRFISHRSCALELVYQELQDIESALDSDIERIFGLKKFVKSMCKVVKTE